MNVSDLTAGQLAERLAGAGLRLRTGPVVSRICSPLPRIVDGIALHYAHHRIEPEESFADFHVGVQRPRGLRRWMKPQVVFSFDGMVPFTPLPGDQEFPMLEWGLNWCVSSHCHQFLILHAAVLERSGRALIMPAPSGSGKSTLCAGLALRGWRLLSDELALIDVASGDVHPLPRPISLKNASIELIRGFAPDAAFSPTVRDTVKGSVAHLRPPAEAVVRGEETARPAWVVVPRYVAGAAPTLQPIGRAEAFMHLAENGFNYHLHGRTGFESLARLVDGCATFRFSYSRLDDAVRLFADLDAPAIGTMA